MLRVSVVSALLVAIAACDRVSKNGPGPHAGGGGSGGEAPAHGETVISCQSWHREPIPGTQNVLVNNTWNEQYAMGEPWTQCLLRRETAAGAQFGWRWDWPPYKPYQSYAAPEALFGWKAWDGGASTTPDLPKRIHAISRLNLDFAVEVVADDTHNLNATMWLTRSDVASAERNPSDITAEIMVWFHNPAGLGGGNTSDGSVTLGDLTFDVSHIVNHGDGSGNSPNTWTMITYISDTSQLATSFDLALVLQDSVAKGLVEPEHAVGGVELITEVFGGSGTLWLDRFDVAVVPK